MIEQLKLKLDAAGEERKALWIKYTEAVDNHDNIGIEYMTALAAAKGFVPGVRVMYGKKPGVFNGYKKSGGYLPRLDCTAVLKDGSVGTKSLGAYNLDSIKLVPE